MRWTRRHRQQQQQQQQQHRQQQQRLRRSPQQQLQQPRPTISISSASPSPVPKRKTSQTGSLNNNQGSKQQTSSPTSPPLQILRGGTESVQQHSNNLNNNRDNKDSPPSISANENRRVSSDLATVHETKAWTESEVKSTSPSDLARRCFRHQHLRKRETEEVLLQPNFRQLLLHASAPDLPRSKNSNGSKQPNGVICPGSVRVGAARRASVLPNQRLNVGTLLLRPSANTNANTNPLSSRRASKKLRPSSATASIANAQIKSASPVFSPRAASFSASASNHHHQRRPSENTVLVFAGNRRRLTRRQRSVETGGGRQSDVSVNSSFLSSIVGEDRLRRLSEYAVQARSLGGAERCFYALLLAVTGVYLLGILTAIVLLFFHRWFFG